MLVCSQAKLQCPGVKRLSDWPETDAYGDPCAVWMCDSNGLSKKARMAPPMSMRNSEDGTKLWAAFLLGRGITWALSSQWWLGAWPEPR